MSKNEFTSIDQFLSQYTGEWGPSDGHWYGLDFSWNGCKYRFHTGAMYESEPLTLPDPLVDIDICQIVKHDGSQQARTEHNDPHN